MVLATVVVTVFVTRGGSDTDPASATTCEELVSRSAKWCASRHRPRDENREDLEEDDPDDPFRSLDEPFANFQKRAQELQCDQNELRRLACDSYDGLDPQGPVAREFLADFVQNCR